MKHALASIAMLLCWMCMVHGQAIQWTKSYGGAVTESAWSIVEDASGNVYVAGGFGSTVDFDPGPGVFNMTSSGVEDAYVLKLDPNGNFLWAKKIGGTNTQVAYHLALDGADNLYVAGRYISTTDLDPGAGVFTVTSTISGAGFCVKLTPAGNFIWGKTVSGTGGTYFQCVEWGGTNNLYFTGGFSNTCDLDPGAGTSNFTASGGNDPFVLKLDTAGNYIWGKQVTTTSNDLGYDLKVDGNGNVVVVGGFSGTGDFDPGAGAYSLTSNGFVDAWILKLDGSGNFVWAKSMGGTQEDYALAVVLDASGSVFTTGTFRTTVDFDPGTGTQSLTSYGQTDIWVQKLDNGGNFQWVSRMGGTDVDAGNGIILDPTGNVITTGSFVRPADFDPGAGTFSLTGGTATVDPFLSKLSPTGAFVWAKQITGPDIDAGQEVALAAGGGFYVCGDFGDSADFDPGPGVIQLVAAGINDAFVQKYNACTSSSSTINPTACNSYTAPGGQVYTSSGTYTATIPNTTGCDSVITINLTILTTPAQPGSISGAASVCVGATYIYSVAAVPGATSYTWTLPNGWTGSSSTNSISATAGSTGGTITVIASNACGSSAPRTLTVTIVQVPAQPGPISGSDTVCVGSSNSYFVSPVTGASTYTWTLPSGWSGFGLGNSTSTTAGSSSGTISVTAGNGCGVSPAQTMAVVVVSPLPQPGAISGSSTVCAGSINTYSIGLVPGASHYVWTLPSGWSGTGTGSSIVATAGSSGGTITVSAVNACGTSIPQSLAVTVSSVPAQPNGILGPSALCEGSSATYSIAGVSGATGYAWALPGGWVGNSNTDSILATAGSMGGNVSVTASNACGTSAAQTLMVSILPNPSAQFGFTTNFLTATFTDMSFGSPTSWHWDFGDGGTSPVQHPVHSYPAAGTYTVCLVATTNGCSDTLCQSVTVIEVGLLQAASGLLQISPNPSRGIFLVRSSVEVKCQLVDLRGRVLDTMGFVSGENALDLTSYADGFYLLRIMDENASGLVRLLKMDQ